MELDKTLLSSRSAESSRRRSLGSTMSTKNQQRRAVETAWRSLDLERDHYLKLMSLNEKLLRSRQGKREDRITKLQSHLTAPEIVEIEAASCRRPNTKSKTMRSTTHVEVLNVDTPDVTDGKDVDEGGDDETGGNNKRSIESSLLGLDRSNSFYGHQHRLRSQTALTTTSEKRTRERNREREIANRDRLEVWSEVRDSQSAQQSRGRTVDNNTPKTKANDTRDHQAGSLTLTLNKDLLSRPIKSGRLPKTNANVDDIRTTVSLPVMSKSFRASSSALAPNPTSAFSCHEKQKRQASERRRSQSVEIPNRSQTPITPGLSNSSNNVSQLAENAVNSERTRSDLRNLMLIENDLQFMHLQRRKEALMSDIEVMVKRDRESAEMRLRVPSASVTSKYMRKSLSAMTHTELMESAYNGANIADLRNEIRRRKNERMRERMKMEMPTDEMKRKEGETEDAYAARMEKWWRDMRKVRYLRRTSSVRPDLSDVVTLAMAQQTNNNIWRQSLRDNLF